MDLWLARHGTTAANREGRFQGSLDFPLSAEGRREAALLARRLVPLALDGIFSSDLSRAWETARIIARENGAPLKATPLLRESRWGVIEGLTREEAAARFPYLERCWHRGKLPLIPGAESRRCLRGRCRLLLERLESRCSPEAAILLVSHGRLLNALLATALGWPARQPWPFAPHPASLSLLLRPAPGSSWRLALFNDCCHLTERLYPGRLLQ